MRPSFCLTLAGPYSENYDVMLWTRRALRQLSTDRRAERGRSRLFGDTSTLFWYRYYSSGEARREPNVTEIMDVFSEKYTSLKHLGCGCTQRGYRGLKENSRRGGLINGNILVTPEIICGGFCGALLPGPLTQTYERTSLQRLSLLIIESSPFSQWHHISILHCM